MRQVCIARVDVCAVKIIERRQFPEKTEAGGAARLDQADRAVRTLAQRGTDARRRLVGQDEIRRNNVIRVYALPRLQPPHRLAEPALRAAAAVKPIQLRQNEHRAGRWEARQEAVCLRINQQGAAQPFLRRPVRRRARLCITLRSRRILRFSAVCHIDDHGLDPAELPRIVRKRLLQRRNVIAAAEQIVQLFIQNRIGSGNQDRLLHGRFLLGKRNACARTCFSDANIQLSILLYII